MAGYCDIGDIELQLGHPHGSSFGTSEMQNAIDSATVEMKSRLAAKFASSLDAWDTNPPDSLTESCARIATALLLNRKADQSLSGQTQAAGLYKSGRQMLDDFIEAEAVILDDDNDGTATDTPVKATTSARSPVFSMGDTDEDTTGTLDDF